MKVTYAPEVDVLRILFRDAPGEWPLTSRWGWASTIGSGRP